MRKTYVTMMTGVALAALGTFAAGPARATPYAYAAVELRNLRLTGLNSPNVTLTNPDETTGAAASYPGFNPSATSAGPTSATAPLTQGSDAPQAFAGPGTAPGQNTFSAALTDGVGVRGDSRIGGNLITGANSGANDVAEGRLLDGGSASSAGNGSTTFGVTVAAPTSFALSFLGSDSLRATTDAAGDLSSARVNVSFTIAGIGATGTSFATRVYAPSELNASVSSSDGTGAGTFATAATPFSYFTTLQAGTYQFSLVSGAQGQLTAVGETATPPTAIAEPASIAMLGAGLLGAGIVRRRRRPA